MAKVKKMAFGGMGSRPPMGGMRPGMGPSRGALGGNQPPAGVDLMKKTSGESGPPQSVMQKMAQAQPRGALGGNQPPAGNNLLREYAQNTQRPGNGVQMPMGVGIGGSNNGTPGAIPDYLKPYMAQAGQPVAPPAPKLMGNAFMKKGGAVKVKAYAKGGSVKSSASSRGDGIAQRGKTKGRVV